MATHVLTYLDQNVNVADSPPAKLIAIAQECYHTIWHAHEWTMRYSTTTVALEPGEETTAQPDAAPTVIDTGYPTWTVKFDQGWRLLTIAMAQQGYRNDGLWKDSLAAYDVWLEKTRIEDDREYWTDLLSATALDMWTLAGMTRQICFELFEGKLAKQQAVPSKRTLLATVGNVTSEAYITIWTMYPWRFRKTRDATTVVTVADTATVALPSDFEKMDDRWMEDESDNGEFVITQDVEEFEALRRANDSDTGVPQLALIEPDGSGAWQLRFTPTPDAAYTYTIVYLKMVDPLASTGTPAWPNTFHRGWHALSRLEAHRRFGSEDGERKAKDEFKDWYATAIAENDKQLTRPQRIERDAYNDFTFDYELAPAYPDLP